MLLPLVRSRRCPYVNLQNQITMWVRFALLKCKSAVNQRISDVARKDVNMTIALGLQCFGSRCETVLAIQHIHNGSNAGTAP